MTNAEIFKYIDHTLLTPTCTTEEVFKLADECAKYNIAAICIPPSHVLDVFIKYPFLNICTVIGFPLGYSSLNVKEQETEIALQNGASEIDMVVNLSDVKDGNFDKVTEEIRAIKAICKDKVLKVIVETCYLTEDEKIALCKCVTEAGADFIKTSTGFGTGGATEEDIILFKNNIGENVKIKASGGIRDKESIEKYINLGVTRIGTSSAIKALITE